jgi:digeranylgeranylglycerophospholipid reductase
VNPCRVADGIAHNVGPARQHHQDTCQHGLCGERVRRLRKEAAVITPRHSELLDVLVVGGGPAGLFAGRQCADAGMEVLLLEEDSVVGQPIHCTGIISLETLRMANVSNALILKRLQVARLHAPSGAYVDMTWSNNDRDPIFAVDRGAFDNELAEYAQRAGTMIRTGLRVSEIVLDKDWVTVSGEGETFRARACVLACGVSYRFQRRLGLGLPGQIVHTAQVEVDSQSSDRVELYFGGKVGPQGFAWLVPVTRGAENRSKIGVLAKGDAGAYLEQFLRRAEIRGAISTETRTPFRRLLPLRPIAKTYADRLLVVGDAGGFTKPTTGGGILYSLLTGSLAAETLIDGLRAGRLDERFISRYEQRWRACLGRELSAAMWFRWLLTRLGDPEIDTLVSKVAESDLQEIIQSVAQFNWHRDVIRALFRKKTLTQVLASALLT